MIGCAWRRTLTAGAAVVALSVQSATVYAPSASAAPVGPPGEVPTTLVSGPQPQARLVGPSSDTQAFSNVFPSMPCADRSFSIQFSDGSSETTNGCAVEADGIFWYSEYLSIGGQDWIIDSSFVVVPIPGGTWLALACAGLENSSCRLGTVPPPELVTEPIAKRGGKVGRAAKFGAINLYEYGNGDSVIVQAGSIAVSANGDWLAIKTRGRDTLSRIDVATGDVLPFGYAPPGNQGFEDRPPLAIDPSGQFIAQGRIDWGSDPLLVWDMAPCNAPPPDGTSLATDCASQPITTLASDPTFTPSRTVFLRWAGASLTFVARFPDGPSAWELVPTSAPSPSPNPAPEVGVAAASPHDALLTRTLVVADAHGAVTIEYGWAASSADAQPDLSLTGQPSVQSCNDLASCTLDYRAATPNAQWYLFARGVDPDGLLTAWSAPLLVQTPMKPILVALGDSITSGHHKDFDGDLTTCDDDAYSYAHDVFTRMQALLPEAWQTSDYLNLAHSGFSTSKILGGGDNACGTHVPDVPITVAEQVLGPRANSWNRVVITAGVDDTNWVSTLGHAIFNSRKPGRYTEKSCTQDFNKWNGYDRNIVLDTRARIAQIATRLRRADGGAGINWVSYYQVAGTGTDKLGGDPILPGVCAKPVEQARIFIKEVITGPALNGQDVSVVDVNGTIGGDDRYIQGFYPSDGEAAVRQYLKFGHILSGWPHPNSLGAAAIAQAVVL